MKLYGRKLTRRSCSCQSRNERRLRWLGHVQRMSEWPNKCYIGYWKKEEDEVEHVSPGNM